MDLEVSSSSSATEEGDCVLETEEHLVNGDDEGDASEIQTNFSQQETQLLEVLVPNEEAENIYIETSMVEMEVSVVNDQDTHENQDVLQNEAPRVSDSAYNEGTLTIQIESQQSVSSDGEEVELVEADETPIHIKSEPSSSSPAGNCAFTCDLCYEKFKGQFSFFEHLRTHYDDSSGVTKAAAISPPITEATATPASSSSKLRERLKLLKELRQNSSEPTLLLPEKDATLAVTPEHDHHIGDLNANKVHLIQPHSSDDTEYYEEGEGDDDSSYDSRILDSEGNCIGVKEEIDSDEHVERDADDEYVDDVKYEEPKEKQRVKVKGSPGKKSKQHQEILCPDCGEFFESLTKLKAHTKLNHDEVVISKKAAAALTRSERLRLRVSTLKCKECAKVFNHKNSLVYHMKGHANERNYACPDCNKKFLTSSALNVHMRLHTGEKPYKCQHCSKPFRQWGDLAYHMVSLHSNVRAYVCEFCGKDFARKYSLTVHRRIHTLERDYTCEFCSKSFRAASYLQSHRRIHTGEKPHNCDVCGKPFRVKSDMKRHRQSHNRHEPKPRIRKEREQAPSRAATASTNNLRVAFTRPKASNVTQQGRGRVDVVEEAVIMHNLVAVDESGQIIELEPQIAEQLRAGQVIQVPLASSSTRATRRITIENEDGSIITGDLEPHDSMNDELKEEMPVEYIQHAVLATDSNDPTQGSLYVWPAFM